MMDIEEIIELLKLGNSNDDENDIYINIENDKDKEKEKIKEILFRSFLFEDIFI